MRNGAGGTVKAGTGTGTAALRATIGFSLLVDLAHKLSLGLRGVRTSEDGAGVFRAIPGSVKRRGGGTIAAGADADAAARATTVLSTGATATGAGAGTGAGGMPNNSRADTVCPGLTAGNAAKANASPTEPAETSAKA
jgi:hypothetical protein